MHRHQGYPVGTALLVIHIDSAEKGDILKIVSESNYRKVLGCEFNTLAYRTIGLHFFKHLVMLLLYICLHTVKELLNVGSTRLSLDAGVTLIKQQQTRLHSDRSRDYVGILLIGAQAKLAYHITECAYLLDGSRLQSEFFKVIRICSLEQGDTLFAGSCRESRKRCISDASGRLVDDSPE